MARARLRRDRVLSTRALNRALLALAHATRYGALEHGAVERILIAKAPPRRLDAYVAEAQAQKFREHGPETRDLAEYDELPVRGRIALPEGERR